MPIFLCATYAEPNHPNAPPARSIDLAVRAPNELAARNVAAGYLLTLTYATTHLYSDTVISLLDERDDDPTFTFDTSGVDWLGRHD